MIWLSPSFPVGAFAFSHGLEWAVETGDVHDYKSVCLWLDDLLQHGSGRSDTVSVALAYKAVQAHDEQALQELTEWVVAAQPSSERRLEALMQGQAFALAIKSAWGHPRFTELCELCGPDLPYSIAFGLACACHAIPLPAALRAYALAFVSNLVSAAIRLGPFQRLKQRRYSPKLLSFTNGAGLPFTLIFLLCAMKHNIRGYFAHDTINTRAFAGWYRRPCRLRKNSFDGSLMQSYGRPL